MRRPRGQPIITLILAGVALACPGRPADPPAATPPDPAVPPIIVDLLRSPDRDMRGLALEQVRQALPGPAATRALAELLPALPTESQIALLDALGERADRAARPAVLHAVTSPDVRVRAAALRALGSLGEPGDTPLLAEKAALGEELERAAARQTLLRPPGTNLNAILLKVLQNSLTDSAVPYAHAAPLIRAEVLRLLGLRKASETAPAVLRYATDPDPSVRLAALGTARLIAGINELPKLIEIVADAETAEQRAASSSTLSTVCARVGQPSEQLLLPSLSKGNGSTRLALLNALAAAAGPNALPTIDRHGKDPDPAVSDQAVRLLSDWPDPAAAPRLLTLARQTTNSLHRILALRGIVRLAGPEEGRAGDMELLSAAWKLAGKSEERRLVLGALAGTSHPAALPLAVQALRDPDLAQEAGLAVLQLANKLPAANNSAIAAALRDVLRYVQDPALRKQAEARLKTLE